MENKKLYKTKGDRVICGVCGGIAEYFNVDPTLIRLGFALFAFCSFGTGVFAYFVAAVIIPDRPQT